MKYIIRKSTNKDCKGIAHAVTIVWNETYKEIVSNEFLDNLYKSEETRTSEAFKNFKEEDNHQFVLEVDNKIVGFINVGIAADESYSNCGEIYALYIFDKYKGFGYGRKLIETGIKELKIMKCDKMIVGCLQDNPSNEFYKHMGGKLIKTRIFKKLNLFENVYLFEKI